MLEDILRQIVREELERIVLLISPSPQSETLLYSVEEAARKLDVSPSKLYQMLNEGVLSSIHIGRSRKIPSWALQAYVEGLENECKEAA